ncbi:MAG: hypothetical protein WB869_08685 [Candidatus Acidiferrales bacterium]|jgi:hypothetical protein
MRLAKKPMLLIFGSSAVVLALLAMPSPLFAQGCVQCYQSAAASGPRAIQALRDGIIVLMFPPFFICVGITFLAYRRRNLQGENS